jgi:hypothetical protein
MMLLVKVLKHALMITSFVFVMMLLIEYLNIQTRGKLSQRLVKSRWGGYFLAAFLGAVPGCLGAFTVVSLYAHRVLSLGALVTAMIATSGDEAFVMFSMFPVKAAWLTLILVIVSLVVGFLTDLLFPRPERLLTTDHDLEVHENEVCACLEWSRIRRQLLQGISFPRALLVGIVGLFLVSLLFGIVGPPRWNWIKSTLVLSSAFALFVVVTVPEHFLEEHLWEHVLKKHLLRVFFWTLGALLVIELLNHFLDLESWVRSNHLVVLLLAVAVGIIPESGPHLIFVTMFAAGTLPFSILLASSVVQDGHGMLPMLAVSKRGFLWVKGINILVGLLVGLVGLALGW